MKPAKILSNLLTMAIFGLWLFSMALVFNESSGTAGDFPAAFLGKPLEEIQKPGWVFTAAGTKSAMPCSL